MATSDLAARAALLALEDAGLEPEQLDQIILCTTTGDWTGASKYYGRAAPIPAFSRPDQQRQRAIGTTPDGIAFENYGYIANHALTSYFYNIEQYL